MERLTRNAVVASTAATAAVLSAFDDPLFRTMLAAALPAETTTIDPAAPAIELLSRFRAEVEVAEAVHAFRGHGPVPFQMSLEEAMNATSRWLWEADAALTALLPIQVRFELVLPRHPIADHGCVLFLWLRLPALLRRVQNRERNLHERK
jgi:hypothetical protein